MKCAYNYALAALFCVSALSAHADDLVQNGDFTQLSNGLGQLDQHTTAFGWSTQDQGYNFIFTQADQAVTGQYGGLALWDAVNKQTGDDNSWNGLTASGGNFLALDGDFQTEPVSQTLTGLVVGRKYNLTFDYAFAQQEGFSGATIQNLTASVGSDSFKSSDFPLPNHGFSGWTHVTDEFTADSPSEVLSFLAHGNLPVPPFALVSNVSILAGGVPEPSSWAMAILGLAGLGAVARRRRSQFAVAAWAGRSAP
jgi:hypothetical protein